MPKYGQLFLPAQRALMQNANCRNKLGSPSDNSTWNTHTIISMSNYASRVSHIILNDRVDWQPYSSASFFSLSISCLTVCSNIFHPSFPKVILTRAVFITAHESCCSLGWMTSWATHEALTLRRHPNLANSLPVTVCRLETDIRSRSRCDANRAHELRTHPTTRLLLPAESYDYLILKKNHTPIIIHQLL